MTRERFSSGHVKLAMSWLVVFLIRLIPLRLPNVEPTLAGAMPVSKRFGAVASFVFAFASIALYDLVTSSIGAWTYVDAFAYGAVGVASALYFKNHEASRLNFVGFGVAGTLAYDALTGLTVGPLAYHQPFMAALIGQIPFTLWHVAGTVVYALLLSPVLSAWFESETFFVPFGALVRSRT